MFDCDWSSDVCSSDLGQFSRQSDASLRDGTSLITLKSEPRIFGKVTDHTGKPVVGARIVSKIGRASCREREQIGTVCIACNDYRGKKSLRVLTSYFKI